MKRKEVIYFNPREERERELLEIEIDGFYLLLKEQPKHPQKHNICDCILKDELIYRRLTGEFYHHRNI